MSKIKTIELTVADGRAIEFNEAKGTAHYTETGESVAIGEHTLSDGRTLILNDEGVASIKEEEGKEAIPMKIIKVMHRVAILKKSKFVHESEMDNTDANHDAIEADGKKNGYAVKWDARPAQGLVIAWLG